MAATDIGTVTKVDQYTVSNRRYRIYDITISTGANYATGGMTLLPATVGLKTIKAAIPLGAAFASGTSTTFNTLYNYTTNKLMAFGTNATPGAAVADVEVTANTNLSTFTVRYQFEGY